MNPNSLQLYHSINSPNARRVRIFIAEKGLVIPEIPIDLEKDEQRSEAYRKINPQQLVPTLVIADGTAIGEVPAIQRYIEDIYPQHALWGQSAKEKAVITMWERRAELEGLSAVMESLRNASPALKGRALAGPYDYEQIPQLAERGRQRVIHFLNDLNARLSEVPYVAGERFSVADITALVTIEFAASAIGLRISKQHLALEFWYARVSSRPSSSA